MGSRRRVSYADLGYHPSADVTIVKDVGDEEHDLVNVGSESANVYLGAGMGLTGEIAPRR